MTTIAQLAPVSSVGSEDMLPLSQTGLLYSVTVSQLTAELQPLITVPTGELLGRKSTGSGGPESISVGAGLGLNAGVLAANGGDHASFPMQSAMSISDDIVVSSNGAPGLLPVTALRGLFQAGTGLEIDDNGVITVSTSAVVGPAGPQGPAGEQGPAGPAGAAGSAGVGLSGPAAGNSASSIGASDYVALWQNGSLAWMPYGQFLGGQTIDQLPAARAVADGDELLVAQNGNSLSVQSFGAIWAYIQSKLPSVQRSIVELTENTVLDATNHNNHILVVSAPITLTANFANMGPGFSCTLINLAAGVVTMGTGITSGSGSTTLPPGATTMLLGLSYSGGSIVWWSGVTPNAPTLKVGSIAAPVLNTSFIVTGGIFNDAPTALDYSTDGGTTWVVAENPVITASAYSFTVPGLSAGTYTLHVRDHGNIAVVGVSNAFVIAAPTISVTTVPVTSMLGAALALSGGVSPANSAVQVGLSASATTAPTTWVNADVNDAVWTGSLTPASVGTYYVWAQQEADTAIMAVSSAVSVVAASISVSTPVSGSVGSPVTVTGSVMPLADTVNIQLATQNSIVPTSGWMVAVNTAGSFSASVTPAAEGTYYVWAQDAASGLTTVSPAIIIAAAPALAYGINDPGGTYVHGVSTIPLGSGLIL